MYFSARTAISQNAEQCGPLALYMSKVKQGQLTEDEYQKKIVTHLNSLHTELLDYRPAPKSNKFIQKVRSFFKIDIHPL